MQRYGACQTSQRLRSSAVTEVYASEDGQRAVKTLVGAPGLDQPHQVSAAAVWMLESAHDQRELAALCDSGWAPVHDLGAQDGRAYVVSDHFAHSLDDLIAPGRGIDPNLLRHIVLELVKGLAQARRLMGRPHGNLKPSNVLVSGLDGSDSGSDSDWPRVCLCDPVPASELRRRWAELADRQDLGRLIVAVVTGRPTLEAGAWPVPFDEAWSRLGAVGEGWRSLASDLLNPAPEAGPMDWDEVARRAELLVPPKVKKSKWPYAAAAAVLLLAAGAVGFFLYPRQTTAPATFDELVVLAREYNNWAATAQAQVRATTGQNAELAAYVKKTPDLAAVFEGRLIGEGSQPLSPRELLGQDELYFKELLFIAERRQTDPGTEAQADVDEVVALLERNKDGARRATLALEAVQQTKAALEAYIDAAYAEVSEGPALNQDATALIDLYAEHARKSLTDPQVHVVPAARRLDKAGAALVKLQGVLKALAQSPRQDDAFVAALRRDLEGGLSELADAQAAQDRPDVEPLLALVERGEQMQQAVVALANEQFIHYPSFRRLHRELYDSAQAGVTPEQMQRWRSAVLTPGAAHVPDQADPRVDWRVAGKAIDTMLAERQAQIVELDELGDRVNAQRSKQTLEKVRTLVQRAREGDGGPLVWVNGNVEAIQQRKAQADRLILDLRERLAGDLVNARRDWSVEVASLRGLAFEQLNTPGEGTAHYFEPAAGHTFSDSAALKRGWQTLRDKAIDATAAEKKAILLQNAVQHAVERLVAIDRGLPADLFDKALGEDVAVAGWDRARTAERFLTRREQAMGELIDTAAARPLRLRQPLEESVAPDSTPDSAPDSALASAVAAEQAELARWVDAVARVIGDYRAVDRFFQAFYMPGETVTPPGDREPLPLSAYYDAAQRDAAQRGIADDLAAADRRLGLTRDLLSADLAADDRQNAVRPALAEVTGVEAQAGADLRGQLEAAAKRQGADQGVRAAAVIARLRLHNTADPQQIDDLIALRGVYQALVGKPDDPLIAPRREAIVTRFESELSLAWQRALRLAEGYEQLNALAGKYPAVVGGDALSTLNPDQPRFGAAPNELPQATRVNLYLALFQDRAQALRQQAPDEPKAQDKAYLGLAKDLRARLAPYRDADPGLATLLTRIGEAIERHESGKQQAIDQPVGPESPWLEKLGIEVTRVDDNGNAIRPGERAGELEPLRRYVFSYGGERQVMHFKLVKPAELGLDDNAPNAYLSVSEVPAKFLIDILDTAGVSGVFSTIARPGIQPTSPVWARQVATDQIVLRDWQGKKGAPAPWVCVENPNDQFVDRAAAAFNEPITDLHPMQSINPSAAHYFARLVGCRLPTDKEWLAANKASVNNGVTPNLRDQAWASGHRRLTEINEQLANTDNYWPTLGTFSEVPFILGKDKDNQIRKVDAGQSAVVGEPGLTDGKVWPRAVDPDAEDFVDLVGNVAEWVTTQTGEVQADGSLKLPDAAPTVQEVEEYFKSRWDNDQLGIIGNSAISCSRSTAHDELVVKSRSIVAGQDQMKYGGHVDVGFRLAFTVGQPSLSATVRSMLNDPLFLGPG